MYCLWCGLFSLIWGTGNIRGIVKWSLSRLTFYRYGYPAGTLFPLVELLCLQPQTYGTRYPHSLHVVASFWVSPVVVVVVRKFGFNSKPFGLGCLWATDCRQYTVMWIYEVYALWRSLHLKPAFSSCRMISSVSVICGLSFFWIFLFVGHLQVTAPVSKRLIFDRFRSRHITMLFWQRRVLRKTEKRRQTDALWKNWLTLHSF